MNHVNMYEQEHQTVKINTIKGNLWLTALTPEIIHIQDDAAHATNSYAVEGNKQEVVPLTVAVQDGKVEITTPKLRIEIDQDGYLDIFNEHDQVVLADYRGQREKTVVQFSEEQQELLKAEGHVVVKQSTASKLEVVKVLNTNDHFYGLGDKTGFLDKRGYTYDNWNTDEPNQGEEVTKLYKSIPFLIGTNGITTYGLFFDNSFASHFDLGKESTKYFYYTVAGGGLDYYFMLGSNVADVVTNYTYLTGRTPLPQKWALGYHQSRYSYKTEQDVYQVTQKLRELQLPCDTVHLDIDYMDGYRVFTVDKNRFPDMKRLLADLKTNHFKVVTIIDPGVKKDDQYHIYCEGVKAQLFATNPDRSVYTNSVWPGVSVYPDFGQAKTRQWWACNQKFLTDLGVSGVWNDMNEPASFNGPIPDETVFFDENQPTTIQKMHNLYGHNMARATYAGFKKQTGNRPFVITRAAYAGTQKYSTVWTGDNRSSWAALQMMIPQLCNLGLSGFSFAGTDIGGFLGDTNPELLTRWIEAGIFSPLLRNHSCAGTRMQEPWQFGEPTLAIYRKYLQLRYQLIDYLYDLFAQGESDGLPIMRPLVTHYGTDPEVLNLNDEFLVGSDLLVAPVVAPGVTKRMVYLPEGSWYDYWTGYSYAGQAYYLVDAPLDQLPLFVKDGAIIPLRPVTEYIDVQAENMITFKLWGEQGTYHHYQDNGADFAYQNGEYNLYEIKMTANNDAIRLMHHGYQPVYRQINLQRGDLVISFYFDATVQTYKTK
nr:glycoside hydrolase family 31 protein [Lapidilactobacillus bayanensis]